MTENSLAVSASEKPRFGGAYRAWLLFLTVCVGAFGFIDRIVISTLGEAIKRDLELTDFQLGILGGLSFAILYSTIGLPIARLAERKSRINIISASIALFSAATVLCGMAASFWHLFLLRVGVGIGEAGVQAPVVSLLTDHFRRERRGTVMTIMKLGSPVGSVVGALAAGWIGTQYGWRAAIISIAAPGIIIAILFRLTLREPPRGMSDPEAERQHGEPPPFSAVMNMMGARPEFRQMLIALSLVTMALFGSGAFYSPFFMRAHGLTLSEIGVYYAVQSGIAATVGFAIGGIGVDFISKRGAKWYALLPAIGVGLSVPFNLVGYSVADPRLALVFLITGAILIFFHNVPTLVAFQNMVGPKMRATAAFVFFFVTTMVGVGLGPAVIGFVSDLYANAVFTQGDFSQLCPGGQAAHGSLALQKACSAASITGIRYALLSATALAAWSSVHYYLASRAIEDERPAAQ
jgi:predicted MFS family arabinose efflux permease